MPDASSVPDSASKRRRIHTGLASVGGVPAARQAGNHRLEQVGLMPVAFAPVTADSHIILHGQPRTKISGSNPVLYHQRCRHVVAVAVKLGERGSRALLVELLATLTAP